MAFDLYFLERIPGRTWIQAMEDLEDADDGRPLAAADLERWARLVDSLALVLPEATPESGDESRALDDRASGIQVSFSPSEISIAVPARTSGDDDALDELLRRVATAIEAETGLIAYDPQADEPFLPEHADPGPTTVEQVLQLVGDPDQPSSRRPGSSGRRFRR